MQNSNPPVVLCFSALDPSGGGGLQADIEALASMGCHCAPVATALCATATADNNEALPVDTTLVIEQARSILEDMPVKAVKVGFAGSVANVEAIHSILQDYPHLPLIIHPAFCLWDRDSIEQADLPAAFAALLLPLSEVAVISLGGIVTSTSLRIGGDELDEAIINHVKKEYSLLLGERTAEAIKLAIASVYPMQEELIAEIPGRDLVSGLPKTIQITDGEIRTAIEEPVTQIIDRKRLDALGAQFHVGPVTTADDAIGNDGGEQ